MKRWPLVASFVLFIALCASLAYWAMQFFKPPVRPVAAPPPSAQAPANIDAAASLFGGKGSAAVASNFQLKGVIMSGTSADSVVIIAADGKPAQAVRINSEIVPGVKVKEVTRGYVVLLDNGVEKRVELPESNTLAAGIEGGSAAPVAARPLPPRPAPAMPSTVVNNSAPSPASANSPETESASASNPATTSTPASASGAVQSTAPAGSAGASGTSGAVPQAAAPAAAPAASPQAPMPGHSMGSPPIMNQGSLAGAAPAPSGTANPAVPGMPVPVPPRP